MDSPMVSTADRGAPIIALYATMTGLALMFLILRFWSRFHYGGVSWDDIFMAISWVFYAVLTVLVGLMAVNGGFKHAAAIDPQHAAYVIKLNYISRPFGIVPLLTVKIAAGCLIFRILRGAASKSIKYGLWSLLALNTIVGVLDAIFTFAQCSIPAALWEPALAGKGTCWSPDVKIASSLLTASLNVVADFVLAVLPAVKIWNLHLPIGKRLGLVALFGSGLFSVVSASIKTYNLAQSTKPLVDLTWESFDLFAWTGTEIFVLHFCASIPAYQPLWKTYISGGRKGESTNQRYLLPNSDYSANSKSWRSTPTDSSTQSYRLKTLNKIDSEY
ncbi:hypothetical protein F5B18DRAFT_617057 [Nemania serpens]|nr:hypothetical protein F5B18DRAFT_617057 [Nemania serpens]